MTVQKLGAELCVWDVWEVPGMNCCVKKRENQVGEPHVESELDPTKKYMYVYVYLYLLSFCRQKEFF